MERWAFITGASGGIGQAIAKRLAKDGYNLYLHYYQNEQAVTSLQHELDVPSYVIQADLTKPSAIEEIKQQLTTSIDLCVHNSGRSVFGLITDMDSDTVTDMVNLHCTVPYLLTKEIIPNMVSKRSGHVVFITSIWGEIGASCETLYSMVKGGQNALVKALAKELAPSGVYVNGVSPGAVQTDMLNTFSEADIQMLTEEIPAQRLAEPNEIAAVVSFLCSKDASYVNGQIIGVNGGWHT
ncbi:elongation factor P 5-aminopentanone reductase [Bacillus solimangrovi]|uniref:3-oxoacyl-ACP reductase n=1 Tax=Bacillus solimangrovi TaxID=1305675 RepID=A0A1E5LJ74_9BACI|nr:SDR family oxidoreductase [Bacillus solimangrovi]OEH94143.1 3-oxoacyl-ACP reductase [Bacillus solimangrovi]